LFNLRISAKEPALYGDFGDLCGDSTGVLTGVLALGVIGDDEICAKV